MIGPKKIEFYQSIRRRQIDQMFLKRRKLNNPISSSPINCQQQLGHLQTIKSINQQIQNSLNKLDYFQILQRLRQLKKILNSCSNYVLKNAASNDYKLVQKIVKILGFMLDSNLEDYQIQPIFHQSISILKYLLISSQVTQDRLYNCDLITILTKTILKQMKHTVHNLSEIFTVFGNSICQSKKLLAKLLQCMSQDILFRLFVSANPQVSSSLTRQFLFFLRCFFDQIQEVPPFNKQQANICKTVLCQSIYYLIGQGFVEDQIIDSLQDAIQSLHRLIDYKLLSIRLKQIPYGQLVDILAVKQCPNKIKKQVLFLIDTVIVLDEKNVITSYLVQNQQLLIKIWGVDAELKYIVYNIFGNVALQPSMKNKLQQFLMPIRLEIAYYQNQRYLMAFLLNYLSSQNFQLKNRIEETIIQTIHKQEEPKNKQVLKILSKIWLGLLFNQNAYIPPHYILQNQDQDIPQTQGIVHILKQRGQNLQ